MRHSETQNTPESYSAYSGDRDCPVRDRDRRESLGGRMRMSRQCLYSAFSCTPVSVDQSIDGNGYRRTSNFPRIPLPVKPAALSGADEAT